VGAAPRATGRIARSGALRRPRSGRPTPDRAGRKLLRSRRQPNAAVAIAHPTNTVMHLGNIAHRVGNVALNYDAATGRFDHPKANALIKPEYRKGYEVPEIV